MNKEDTSVLGWDWNKGTGFTLPTEATKTSEQNIKVLKILAISQWRTVIPDGQKTSKVGVVITSV